MGKHLKVGVHLFGGPPPGYRWNVLILERAFQESRAILNNAQLDHLAMQWKMLAQLDDPLASAEHDIKSIEHFHELRDWGGVLHPLSVRVFFYIWHEYRALCVISVMVKTKQRTPLAQLVKVRKRIRLLKDKQWGEPSAILRKTSLK